MNSRAKIGTLAKTDPALLVPYGGEQRAIGELQALGVTLTPEDYRVIRQSLGGGKRGRARARELVPLQCPTCESRLTHYERSGREPYFAATVESSSHGPHCEVVEAAAPAAVAEVARGAERGHASAPVAVAPVAVVAPVEVVSNDEVTALFEAEAVVAPVAVVAPAAVVSNEEVTALSEDDLEFSSEALVASDTPPSVPAVAAPPVLVPAVGTPAASTTDTTYYFIEGEVEPSAGAQRLGRLGLGSTPPGPPVEQSAPRGTQLADARQLLIQALNRALPGPCVVRYRGQDYPVVAAADLHQHLDGERVAVYGRLTESEWNPQAGRLTLKAMQRTVQVWATAAAPRQLLQVESTDWLEAPVLAKPMPFLAFGTLRRLGPTCGIPVIRGDSLILLQPLTAVLREPSAEPLAAQDGLTVLPAADEPRETDPGDLRETDPGDLRETDPGEPRDSELYELYDNEPDQLVHDATAWNLGSQPSESADARADGLALSPAGTSLAAPDLTAPARARGALSTLRSFASSLRRSK